MNRNTPARWALLIAIVLVGLVYAAPNLFGDDAAVQVSLTDGDPVAESLADRMQAVMDDVGIAAKAIEPKDGRMQLRLQDGDAQLAAADALRRALGNDYVVALNQATRTPQGLLDLGAQPMSLGLDLRGGVHFLLEVDIEAVQEEAVKDSLDEILLYLRGERLRYSGYGIESGGIRLDFREAATANRALAALQDREDYRDLVIAANPRNATQLTVVPTDEAAKELIDFAVKKNLTTLRTRVNQLGVSEPIVQRQGLDRILVQLPGVQDPAQVKGILETTATLEYRAVAEDQDADRADRTGVAPIGTELYYERDTGRPILLKRKRIAGGNDIVNARATIDTETGSPAVAVTLSGKASRDMFEFTEKNVGKLMAVLYQETVYITEYDAAGNPERKAVKKQDVINAATIRGVFGKNFQTTGLTSGEAQKLATLLRAGALAAPVAIIEERTIGPSLGQDNIDKGRLAVIIGFVLVVAFMLVYYRVFGLFANLALVLNLVLIMAVLSMLQATLTLPGIAGILLTVGMAVDANVLIFQRIREELAAGAKVQEAISGGYDKAFWTIADANLTTLIAAVVLFIFGTGPVKGFAVTLSIGIVTSMFTAIIGTRILVNAFFGKGRRLATLPI